MKTRSWKSASNFGRRNSTNFPHLLSFIQIYINIFNFDFYLHTMQRNWIDDLVDLVKNKFTNESADHDWKHIERVYHLAMKIQQKEGGSLVVVQALALLHDISDHKLNGGLLNDNARVGREILSSLHVDPTLIDQVCHLLDAISFKGAGVPDEDLALELAIVRDADRLDAMGAIGIARAFHYGGKCNRPLYDEQMVPGLHTDFQTYAKSTSHTLNHFYEKLLLLNDRLITPTAKEIGAKRHQVLCDFVDQFLSEWNIE